MKKLLLLSILLAGSSIDLRGSDFTDNLDDFKNAFEVLEVQLPGQEPEATEEEEEEEEEAPLNQKATKIESLKISTAKFLFVISSACLIYKIYKSHNIRSFIGLISKWLASKQAKLVGAQKPNIHTL
jgi:hypothetical protein